MNSYKQNRLQNEKQLKTMIESNLKGMAEMLACKRDLKEYLRMSREALTKHDVKMQEQLTLQASLEGAIYNEKLKENNLKKQIQVLRQEIAVVQRHHYEEVKPVYDSQLGELSGMKKAMQESVRDLQQTTQEMRDANKLHDNKCHVELLRHEESLQTLEKVQ